MNEPFVSVLVLNLNGRSHLETCLPSLEALHYPRDRFEVTLVDNGSTDDSVAWTRANHPGTRIISHPRNLGFATGYNKAVSQTDGDFVALLNNDTRVAKGWLRALVSAAERHNASCVGSVILDWDGRLVDFAGAVVSLVGHSWQDHYGMPVESLQLTDRRLLFACGGSMLVRRAAFQQAGGFDERYFAYFEDVDLGWRMALLGHPTVLAADAITYHRLHGTWGRWAFSPRLRLYERNALYTIYKCYEQATLERVLPVAVALTLARGLRHSRLDPDRFAFGTSIPDLVPVSPQTIGTLIALEDFARHLPDLEQKRRDIQSRRIVSDAQLLPLFVEPLKLHEYGTGYQQLARQLYDEFGLHELVGEAGIRDQGTGTRGNGREPEAESREPVDKGQPGSPLVSVVILTALGPTHLPECLASLQALDFPRDQLEVIVVDNGSREDPTRVVHDRFPGARVIRFSRNQGFSAGNNAGAREARGKWVAFLNDDTRVDRAWISEMLATAEGHESPCVGAQILDWTGKRIDFAGAEVNFEGKGFQLGLGSPEHQRASEEQPLLAACGAAMLVSRDLFLEIGGFDEAYFAYYEDLALGWQYWIRGYEVWFAPKAIVYHKHHGTSARWADASRIRLYERNGLRTVFSHLEPQHLRRVLPAALLLASERALLAAGLGFEVSEERIMVASWLRRLYWRLKPQALLSHMRIGLLQRGAGRIYGIAGSLRRVGVRNLAAVLWSTIRFAFRDPSHLLANRAGFIMEWGHQEQSFDSQQQPVPAKAAAALAALEEWLASIAAIRDVRSSLQLARRRTDRDVLRLFGSHWTAPAVSDRQSAYCTLHDNLVRALELDRMANSRKH